MVSIKDIKANNGKTTFNLQFQMGLEKSKVQNKSKSDVEPRKEMNNGLTDVSIILLRHGRMLTQN